MIDLPTARFAALGLACSLVGSLVVGCKVSADTSQPDRVEPCPEPEAPSPVQAPRVYEPLVHGTYATEIAVDSGDLRVEKQFEFVGNVIRVRVRYLAQPEGDIARSTFSTCEAELELPIRWTESGYSVGQTLTVTAQRGDFEREELEPAANGNRQASTHKDLRSCWLTVLEGEYVFEEISAATTRGRAESLRLVEPDGAVRALRAVESASESDFIDVVDEHFWSGG